MLNTTFRYTKIVENSMIEKTLVKGARESSRGTKDSRECSIHYVKPTLPVETSLALLLAHHDQFGGKGNELHQSRKVSFRPDSKQKIHAMLSEHSEF